MTVAVAAGTEHESALGFRADNLRAFERSGAYRDLSTVWVMPLRDESVNLRVVGSWMVLEWPENQSRSALIPEVGKEVGAAYNALIERVSDRGVAIGTFGPDYGERFFRSRFIFTSESDNILPPKCVKKLLESIYECPDCGGVVGDGAGGAENAEWVCAEGHRGYDAVSGLYFMKTDPPIPMAFGDPAIPGDFKPRSVLTAIDEDRTIEVNGIAMGCAIWRKDLFRKVSRPWFETTPLNTQDIYFCKKAKEEAGARFGVRCGVKVGHIDFTSGVIF